MHGVSPQESLVWEKQGKTEMELGQMEGDVSCETCGNLS